jgi:hypothetical protein
METLLDREAAKTPAVEEHRGDLEEVTAYLGWYLQSLAETTGSNGRLATKSLRRALNLNDYLFIPGSTEEGHTCLDRWVLSLVLTSCWVAEPESV